MKIVIWTPPFLAGSGGITALHKLCHLLRLRGIEAFVWIDKSNPTSESCCFRSWNTPIANGVVDPKECVVIYPEIVKGNPLQSSRVVRWLLNRPGAMGGDGIFGPSDMILHFLPVFDQTADPMSRLTLYEPWLDLNAPGTGPRSGGCFTVRKGHRKARVPETSAMQELPWTSPNEYASIFKTKSTFVSYDTATFLSIQAALCGCVSVVVPDPGVTGAEWRRGHLLTTYGIAYGFDEIPWAQATMHLVPQVLAIATAETDLQLSALLARLGVA